MKKVLTILVTAMVISVVLVTSLGSTAFAAEDEAGAKYGYQGSAPNSGDGDPDGSGTVGRIGPEIGRGPAPNSGDGDPDGSGF